MQQPGLNRAVPLHTVNGTAEWCTRQAAPNTRPPAPQGGYRGWQDAGLPVRGDGAYAASPLDALADEAQLLSSGTSVAFSGLKCALPPATIRRHLTSWT